MPKFAPYHTQIKEYHLDTFGHVNHAVYFTIMEQARWEICNQYDMGVYHIQKSGVGPVILNASIQYKKELKARDKITIYTEFQKENSKLFYIKHQMIKENEETAAEAQLLAAIWDTEKRKIIRPPEEWLKILS